MAGSPHDERDRECDRSEFLRQLLDDEEHGRLRPVEHYVAAFPQCAEFVQSEYATLVGTASPARAAVGASASRVGRYRVLGELARGGMGTVLEAEDPELDRRVVLKALQPTWAATAKARERLKREARVLGGLDHPHLLKIIDVVDEGGAIHLVMPLVPGRTLAAHLLAARSATGDGPATGRALPSLRGGQPGRTDALRALLQFFVQVANAVHAAHTAGIVHRDLKPENLMVQADGSPMVLDFGLAVPADEPGLTTAGEMLGTPLYMAPEQIDGQPVTPATDVFALGVVLYEALTLVHPFGGVGGRAATFQRVLAADPVPLRRHDALLSRDLEAVVGKALDREPARRYASAEALAKDLQRVLDLEPTEARPVSGLTAAFRRLRRRPRTVIASALVVAAVLCAAVVFVGYLRQTEKVQSTLRVLDDEQRPVAERLDAARAVLLRSPNGGQELLPIHPRADVGPVEAFVWFGYAGTDEQYLPGERLAHRYRVVVRDEAGGELWQREFEQSPASTWCELRCEAPATFPGVWRWDVQWLGATDATGRFTAHEEGDGPRRFAEPVVCRSIAGSDLPLDLPGLQSALQRGLASWVLWRSHDEALRSVPEVILLELRGDAAAALADEVLQVHYRTLAAAKRR